MNMKNRQSNKVVLAASLGLVLVGGCGWMGNAKPKADLVSTLQTLAGPKAKDCSCSTMPISEAKWKAMRDCAAKSYAAKQPFWVREDYDANAKGAKTGVVLGKEGTYYQVRETNGQIEMTRGVGTKLVTHPQTGERYIWSRRIVKVPQKP